MYKLVAFDLDGTLLNSEKEIHSQDLKAIKKMIDNNIKVIIATGRRYYSAAQILKNYDLSVKIIANNGNVIRYSHNDKLIFKNTLPYEMYLPVLKISEGCNARPVIHVDGYDQGYDVLITPGDDYIYKDEYMEGFNGRVKYLDNLEDISKEDILAIVFVGELKDLEYIKKRVEKEFSDNYNTHILRNLQGNLSILEILNGNSDKWYSIKNYAIEKNISKNEIIAVGDGDNDLRMVTNAGLGIAMCNGSEAIKSAAQIETDYDNDNRGAVLKIMEVLNLDK